MTGTGDIRRWLGILVRGLILWALVALVFYAAVAIIPGFDLPSFGAAVLTTGLIALINIAIWPLLIRLVLPLTVFTFGLGSLALNAVVVMVAVNLVDGDPPSFWAALVAAFVLSVALMVLTPALSFDRDARQLRVVRRRARNVAESNRTDVPGVIMFEIDGLAEPVLRRALAEGHAPNIARWLDSGSHRVVPWECDLSSQTGASQAGLLLGSNHDMPAFRWYEKESGRTMVSNHGKDATEIEQRRSDGGGLLAMNGASRGNMFSGDAPRCTATMSVIRDRSRSRASDFFAYFADPYGFTRTLVSLLLGRRCGDGRCAPPAPSRRGARRARRRLPLDARLHHRDHARPERRRSDGRHRRGRARRLLDVRRLRRGRAPLRHHRAGCLRGAQAARRPARAPRESRRAGAAPLPPRRALRSRPDTGAAISPALRGSARGRRRGGARARRGLRARRSRRGSGDGRQRAHRCPRRGQRRGPGAGSGDEGPARGRAGDAGRRSQGGRGGRRGGRSAHGDRARLGRARAGLATRARPPDEPPGDRRVPPGADRRR